MKTSARLILIVMLILIATTAGAASKVEAAALPAAAPCGATYTVQSGDYLSLIATKCGVAYTDLLKANPNLTNPDVVSAGQVINIPKIASSGTTTPGSTTANGTATANGSSTANGSTSATPAASIPNTGNTANGSGGNSAAGNSAATSATSAAAAGGRTYTIQTGDTLSSIAQAYNVSLTDLINANPSITDSNTIFAGRQLILPSNASATPNSSGTSNGSTGSIPNTGGTGSTYTVQTGDTLSAIAVNFNTTVTALVNANATAITNPDLIFPGQVINIR